ncbi:hypothetical protein BSZ39_05285 [Bowdeniella nasicola]|uniref:Uncharacterized protein n=2 Tax=Bowdeniella nasicola TaxID=208480 RepID=A0A1Q5Q366_9ACTO|nr:hypothetical protein BSZ39_05285 [Bowdeniella nasicola]
MIALPPSEGKTLPEPARPVDLAELALGQLSKARARIAAALAELGTGDAAAETLSVGPKARADLVKSLVVV